MDINNSVSNKSYSYQYKLNFGPQHPAAHGVLRLVIELRGEIIKYIQSNIGLLHRGTEKLIEYKTYAQALPYFDRLDYVSMMAQEHCFSLVQEKIMNIYVPLAGRYIRVIFLELTRILNHLMATTTHAMDIGAVTPFLWAFEEREKIMEFYERVSGARMHSAYIRPGGVALQPPFALFSDISQFLVNFLQKLEFIEELLVTNRIWQQRLVSVGFVKKVFAEEYAFSGVMLRGSGFCWDLRKILPYEEYSNIQFTSPIGVFGDCFDRFLLRIEEMRQSCKIISFVLTSLHMERLYTLPTIAWNSKSTFGVSKTSRSSMESLIQHFKTYTENTKIFSSKTYTAIEAPKGEFGVFLGSIGENSAYRLKIRSPGYFHLQGINGLAINNFIADTVAIIGTLDLVLGEIDR